ncbi:MAG: hypothetical protein K8F91_13405, partial [Candidatus Obscuribacterales bacterium]|nr:hypothetical protein [Candidatus Obscuribacterales bacterium]
MRLPGRSESTVSNATDSPISIKVLEEAVVAATRPVSKSTALETTVQAIAEPIAQAPEADRVQEIIRSVPVERAIASPSDLGTGEGFQPRMVFPGDRKESAINSADMERIIANQPTGGSVVRPFVAMTQTDLKVADKPAAVPQLPGASPAEVKKEALEAGPKSFILPVLETAIDAVRNEAAAQSPEKTELPARPTAYVSPLFETLVKNANSAPPDQIAEGEGFHDRILFPGDSAKSVITTSAIEQVLVRQNEKPSGTPDSQPAIKPTESFEVLSQVLLWPAGTVAPDTRPAPISMYTAREVTDLNPVPVSQAAFLGGENTRTGLSAGTDSLPALVAAPDHGANPVVGKAPVRGDVLSDSLDSPLPAVTPQRGPMLELIGKIVETTPVTKRQVEVAPSVSPAPRLDNIINPEHSVENVGVVVAAPDRKMVGEGLTDRAFWPGDKKLSLVSNDDAKQVVVDSRSLPLAPPVSVSPQSNLGQPRIDRFVMAEAGDLNPGGSPGSVFANLADARPQSALPVVSADAQGGSFPIEVSVAPATRPFKHDDGSLLPSTVRAIENAVGSLVASDQPVLPKASPPNLEVAQISILDLLKLPVAKAEPTGDANPKFDSRAVYPGDSSISQVSAAVIDNLLPGIAGIGPYTRPEPGDLERGDKPAGGEATIGSRSQGGLAGLSNDNATPFPVVKQTTALVSESFIDRKVLPGDSHLSIGTAFEMEILASTLAGSKVPVKSIVNMEPGDLSPAIGLTAGLANAPTNAQANLLSRPESPVVAGTVIDAPAPRADLPPILSAITRQIENVTIGASVGQHMADVSNVNGGSSKAPLSRKVGEPELSISSPSTQLLPEAISEAIPLSCNRPEVSINALNNISAANVESTVGHFLKTRDESLVSSFTASDFERVARAYQVNHQASQDAQVVTRSTIPAAQPLAALFESVSTLKMEASSHLKIADSRLSMEAGTISRNQSQSQAQAYSQISNTFSFSLDSSIIKPLANDSIVDTQLFVSAIKNSGAIEPRVKQFLVDSLAVASHQQTGSKVESTSLVGFRSEAQTIGIKISVAIQNIASEQSVVAIRFDAIKSTAIPSGIDSNGKVISTDSASIIIKLDGTVFGGKASSISTSTSNGTTINNIAGLPLDPFAIAVTKVADSITSGQKSEANQTNKSDSITPEKIKSTQASDFIVQSTRGAVTPNIANGIVNAIKFGQPLPAGMTIKNGSVTLRYNGEVFYFPGLAAALKFAQVLGLSESEQDDEEETLYALSSASTGRVKYVVEVGDTLETIAETRLGDSRYADLIVTINRAEVVYRMVDGALLPFIYPTQMLWLPSTAECRNFAKHFFNGKAVFGSTGNQFAEKDSTRPSCQNNSQTDITVITENEAQLPSLEISPVHSSGPLGQVLDKLRFAGGRPSV